MTVYPITIELVNGIISSRRLGNAFDENDPALTTYMDAEYRGHISRVGHTRIIRLITEEIISQHGWNKVLSWYEVEKEWDYIFEPTDLINYGEQLEDGQVVLSFSNDSNPASKEEIMSYLKVRYNSLNHTVGIMRFWDKDSITCNGFLTHVGMLRAKQEISDENDYYDEVMTIEQMIDNYNHPNNHLSTYPDLISFL